MVIITFGARITIQLSFDNDVNKLKNLKNEKTYKEL